MGWLHLFKRGGNIPLQRACRAQHERSDRPGSRKIVPDRNLHQSLGEFTAAPRIPDNVEREAGDAIERRERQRMLQGI